MKLDVIEIELILKPGIVTHAWRLRQEDSRLKTSLTMGYIVSSRSATADNIAKH